MDNPEKIMGIIMHGGNARSLAMQAIEAARNTKSGKAELLIKEAKEELTKAHHIQTNFIQAEAKGEKTEISLLMIHAQDHLMNAMTVKDLASEIISLNLRINENGGN